jgi:Uma2 family endonuclease
MMAVQPKLMTVEEFWERYAGLPYELVGGVPVSLGSSRDAHGKAGEGVPTGYLHAAVEHLVSKHLGAFVEKNPSGVILTGEAGFQLGPDELRAADVAFIRNERLAAITEPGKYIPFPPDLAVEIVSPGDTASEVQTKVDHYLAAGTPVVWVIYPELRRVTVFEAEGQVRLLGQDATLDGGVLLPGLNIPVADLFPPEK